jgi:hypothetical protein
MLQETRVHLAASLMAGCLVGCATIPPEAPELSAQLGTRISAVESAHRKLLGVFFVDRKKRVDEFIQNEWIPQFASELFADKRIAEVWNEVVKSENTTDRLKFILYVGPQLQQKINAKRIELMQPLEELENTIANRLKGEYDNMRAINNTLTAFLQSASKVEENRKRYLEMIGISDKQVDDFIHETDHVVSDLVKGAKTAEQRVKDAETYKKKVDDLMSKIRRKGG